MIKQNLKYLTAFLFIIIYCNTFSQTKKPVVLSLGTVNNYSISVDGNPFDVKNDQYSLQRRYFTYKNDKEQIVILWQDQSNLSLKLTTLNSTYSSQITKIIQTDKEEILIASATDSTNLIYFLSYKAKFNLVEIFLKKIDFEGKIISSKNFYSFANSTNIYGVDDNICSMKSNGEEIIVLLSRKMYKSSDGLNHQAGLAMSFNCRTLDLVTHIENTTSHSFQNYLFVDSKKTFVGLELGDNYPRGINVHKFKGVQHKSRVVYTYKTLHSQQPNNNSGYKAFPFYTEISTPSNKYYKWSNDNNTYTNLGGIIEDNEGYFIFFLGEPSPAGMSLDNSRASSNLDPKNIGFVKIQRYFEAANENVNCVTEDVVLSKGKSEIGGFYGYSGQWFPQKNMGVTWLTNYKDINKNNIRNLKSIKLSDGTILLIWENYKVKDYTKDFIGVFGIKLNASGVKISPIISLGNKFRLPVSDEILYSENKLFLINGLGDEKKINLTIIDLSK